MERKYFWLKLKDDFFAQKEIKKLRKIAGGDTYTIIYLKIQLLSVKNEGKLYFEGIEDSFYEELALSIDEEPDNVKVTLLFLQKCGLIEELNEEEFLLPKVCDIIGTEGSSAERVRKHRDKQKALQCNTNVTKCNVEKRREEQIRVDLDVDVDRKKVTETKIKNVYSYYNENIGMIVPFVAQDIEYYLADGIEEELIIKYIQIACERNIRTWAYIKAMIKGNKEKNILTLEQFESHQLEYKAKNNNKKEPESVNLFKKLMEEGAFDE